MTDHYAKFLERTARRKRRNQSPETINADMQHRSNQQRAIQKWAEQRQAEAI